MGALLSISLEQGLVFAVLAIGVFITYKILDFPDLSVEGTFPFGAFIFSKFMLLGLDPISSTLLSFIFGSLAGVLTYALHIKMKIAPILAGILTMTILYSVNLRVNGKANIPLYNYSSIFDYGNIILILIVIVLLIKFLMDMFLKTERGYLLIATGDNETLVKSLGVNCNTYKLLGLMLSNGIVAVSGALMGQLQGFADINMGASIIVSALASIIIGDTFLKNSKKYLSNRKNYGILICVGERYKILKHPIRGSVGTGRRARLRILWWLHRVGSSPIFRTKDSSRKT